MLKIFVVMMLMIALTRNAVLAYDLSKNKGEFESTVKILASENQPLQKLRDVKKIFVASFGTGEGVEIIRDKVINRLLKTNIILVDSAKDADATLTGSVQANSRFHFFLNDGFGTGRTRYSAELVVRLVGKNHEIFWVDEVKSNWLHRKSSSSAGSDVANKVVEDLCKAINKEQEANQISYGK